LSKEKPTGKLAKKKAAKLKKDRNAIMPSYDDESSSEEIKVSSAPKRKPLPRVSKRKHKEILLMDDSVESDFDPNEDDEGSPHRREKRKTPSTKTPGKKEGNYVCPHCQKTFSSEGGLKYHTSKFVCRLEQSTDPQVKARGTKRRRGKGKKGDTPDKRRFRGSLENRTCPHCNRVFTSALGMNYHISKSYLPNIF
jgi:transcription elongation factor Elf1